MVIFSFCWCSLLPGQLFDQFDFFRAVGRAIGAKDFMKPDRRIASNVGLLPGIPRQKGLCLTRHESPVDRRYFVPPGDGQRTLESALIAACHVLSAEKRSVVTL